VFFLLQSKNQANTFLVQVLYMRKIALRIVLGGGCNKTFFSRIFSHRLASTVYQSSFPASLS
jgi:hypothetical protein